MNNIKISVVVPTFNRASLLSELFDCLLKQTFTDFEIIISDDGSYDNTNEVVNQYSSKLNILYIYNENWGGPARPRNLGINLAKSEWICFLDSDDLWKDNKLEEMYKIISTNKYDVIYHSFSCNIGSKKITLGKPSRFSFLDTFEKLIFEGNHFVNSSLCIRKMKLKEVDYLSEDKNIIGVEDYDLLIKLARQKSKFYFVNKILGEYRLNEDNISSNMDSQISKISIVLNKYINPYNKSSIESLLNYYRANNKFKKNKYRESIDLYLLVLLNKSSFLLKLKSLYKLIILLIRNYE